MVHVYNPSTYPHQETKTVKVFEKWLLYLVVLSIAGISLYWYLTNRGKEFEVKIVTKSGAVEYRESGKEAWKEVDRLPFEVKNAYEIRTLGDSGATFLVGDGSTVILGNFTRIVLAKNQGEVDWVQSDGDTHHQVASNSARGAYKVSVSDGEFSASGTAFEVKIRDSDTSVLVLDGQINAVYKDKSTATAKAGEKITINPVGKRVLAIEDQELKDVWTSANLENDRKNNLSIDAEVLKLAGLSSSEGEKTENTVEEQVTVKEENVSQEAKDNQTEALIQNDNKNQNQNTNSVVTGDNVQASGGTSESENSTTATATSDTQNKTSSESKSGATTRGKCEGSGGHWLGGDKVCKCPPGEYFNTSVGRCQRK